MSKPAARIGDQTAHGGKIVQGDTSVLIGGKPAARIGDAHACPHHGTGPVVPPCSPPVLINGRPAARIGDQALCGGPDTIVSGDTTVLIGEGAAAAPAAPPAPGEDWVDLHYTYADGTGVPRAKYVVLKGGVEVARGALDDQGKAHVKLPVGTDKISYYFDDDPETYKVHPEHKPRPSPYLAHRSAQQRIENERSTWETVGSWVWGKTASAVNAAGEALESSGEWVWGVLRGDFNEDPSMGQIVVRGVISFVPILGQALDVQDIVSAIYFLVWKKRFKEAMIWFALVVTLLGCIPLIGDAGKIAFKMLKKLGGQSDTLAKLLAKLNTLGKGNGVQWLKELSAKLPALGQEVATTFKKILDDIAARLTKIGSYRLLRRVKSDIDEVLATIREVREMVDDMFKKVVDDLKSKLDDALGNHKRVIDDGPTRTELKTTQDADLSDARALGKGMKTSPKQVDDHITGKYGKHLDADKQAGGLAQKNTQMMDDDEFLDAWSKGGDPSQAGNVDGFYDPNTGKIAINADGAQADRALLHESLHGYSSDTFRESVPTGFNEGVTEYLTGTNAKDLGLEGYSGYPSSTWQAERVAKVVGDDTLAKAYFSGDIDGLKTAYEANHLAGDPKTWGGLMDKFDAQYAKDVR